MESQSDATSGTPDSQRPQGSEDLMVPDSEDDEDEESSMHHAPPALDLQRFSFAAQ